MLDQVKELETLHKHVEICTNMTFPPTKELRERRENAIVRGTYHCNEQECDFSSVYKSIREGTKLVEWQMQPVCEDIVRDIETHQANYLPSKVDGYVVTRMGHEMLHLKRNDADSSSVTGRIECQDVLKSDMKWTEEKNWDLVSRSLTTTDCIIC